jgi:hypothetical protein
MKKAMCAVVYIILLCNFAFPQNANCEFFNENQESFRKCDIPFYMVIIGSAPTQTEAEELAKLLLRKDGVVYNGDWYYPKSGSLGAGYGIYDSGLWPGLEPGYYVVADGLFISRSDAEELKKIIKPSISDVYIKKVSNPRIQEILYVSDDINLIIWSNLGYADFEEIHFTDLKKESDILLCRGRRASLRGGMMMHTWDNEIEPIKVDEQKECFYFYDNGPKVFYFNSDKPRDIAMEESKTAAVKRAVQKSIKESDKDINVRWIIDDKACVSATDSLSEEERLVLTDFIEYNRTLFFLELQDDEWIITAQARQYYMKATCCYH